MIESSPSQGMKPKPLKAADLNAKFSESKTQLTEHLAEARTNVNLFIGNHFQKKNKSLLSRAADKAGADSETKIRVTKNHTNTICKFIINSILAQAPTGVIQPKNPSEIQDQKSAEIHGSVFEDFKVRNKFNSHVRRWAHDYIINGEVFLNVFWDDNKGIKLFEEQMVDPITNEVMSSQIVREGDVVMERIYSWDIRMDVGAKSFDEAMWVGYEKMVDRDVILKTFGDSQELKEKLATDMDETYKVFDGSSGTYQDSKGKILLRQIYYRPCLEYPNGYYVYFTKNAILAEGELPTDHAGNVFFPIKHLGFDEIPTSPRSASLIRNIRPDQMEINRCASAIALTQMTVGFDKMITTTGGEVDANSQKAGIRIIRTPGGKATSDIIPGRSGEQFLNTMNSAISEMYRKMGVPEIGDEKTQDTDILASLYKNQRQKMRFSLYADKFSEFLVDVIETVLKLKKAYMRDEAFVRIVGKNERVNIPEFRSMDDIGFQIKVEPGSEDLETRYGKHIALTNTMQYLGQNLDKNTIGMLLKQMPFNNSEEIYSEYTLEYDTARNIMLALDRGEQPEIVTSGNPDYFFKMLEHRQYKPDFKFLPEQVKLNYMNQTAAYKELYNQNVTAMQRAKQGFIPADGPMVPIDGMYETVPGANGQPKTQRAMMYQSSLKWLFEQLAAQKQALGKIETLPLGQQAELAQQNIEGTEMPQGPVNASGF